jgi:glutaminyl-peptide cyclotransferase
MNFKKVFIFLIILTLAGCEEKMPFDLNFITPAKKLKLNGDLKLEITSKDGSKMDSVSYVLQNLKGKTNENLSIKLNDVLLGEHELKLKIYAEGEIYETSESIKIFNDQPPKIYKYEVVNAYPHDINAYTQGLEFYDNALYESIGQYGKSALRKVELETGKVLKEHKMKSQYFGEGITIFDDKIFQLTWREGEGLIYDVNTFEVLDKFRYNNSEEGWGLCHDDDYIYKSDGTEKIWRLSKENLSETDYIQATTHNSISEKMNEMEFINGRIYANTYGKDGVAIINPKNGAIEAVIDFRKLKAQVRQHERLDVLNGIAYNPVTDKLYVTGKNWNKLFEVKIISK